MSREKFVLFIFDVNYVVWHNVLFYGLVVDGYNHYTVLLCVILIKSWQICFSELMCRICIDYI